MHTFRLFNTAFICLLLFQIVTRHNTFRFDMYGSDGILKALINVAFISDY